MKYFLKSLLTIYNLYGFASFILLMLLLFPLVLVASLFGKIKGGNFIYKILRFWADAWFVLISIHHTNIFEQPHDSSKQYIFLSNHISYLDIPVMMKAVRKQHMRILGKSEMAKMPIFGIIYKSAVVMVNRKDAEQRRKSVSTLKAILRKNISIFICPEGTFNLSDKPLKEFYDGAFRIAIETQTPIKPILFLDTFKRLNNKSVLSLNPGRSRAVYLDEVITEGLVLDDLNDLKNNVYNRMEEGLIRYKASWINISANVSGLQTSN